ncbi:MAG: TonB family protein [Acidobacteria bacterium]|nr:TonB family protein [Acidobacteriota bacterium]
MITKTLAACVVIIGVTGIPGWSATSSQSRVRLDQPALAEMEDQLRHLPVHLSEFSPVSEPLALPRCGNVRPPEALVTPDPMLQFDEEGPRVRVSFIVGADGRVHSPFILDSGGTREDQMVLRAVGRWRYRPALCNGVPTDSEARIQFGIR